MTKRQKRGCGLVVLGVILILMSLFLHLTQEKQDQIAGENAQILLQQLELNQISIEPAAQEDLPQEAATAAEMPEKEYLGYSMIGTIRVPSVSIELPVLSNWSYELINVAHCRYSGFLPDGNMILMGHNYKSHFTPLHDVAEGAAVEFEDVNGIVYRYTVVKIETLHKNDGELLPSEYPLTLFTCTRGGQNRVVVRCQSNEK